MNKNNKYKLRSYFATREQNMMSLFFLCSLLLHDKLKTDEKSKLDFDSRVAPSISLKEKILVS